MIGLSSSVWLAIPFLPRLWVLLWLLIDWEEAEEEKEEYDGGVDEYG